MVINLSVIQSKLFALTNDPDTFQQGATVYRNGRGWAKLQRDQVIAQANERTGRESVESPQSDALGVSFASDASGVTIEAMDQWSITNSGSHALPSLYAFIGPQTSYHSTSNRQLNVHDPRESSLNI
jgi:hypothetical protein